MILDTLELAKTLIARKSVTPDDAGCMELIWPDIIDTMAFDAKHSFEDAIEPVEQAYERLSSRIAVIGGMDVDFVCRSTPAEVYRRARAMVERSAARGSYALGTGNYTYAEIVSDGTQWLVTSKI